MNLFSKKNWKTVRLGDVSEAVNYGYTASAEENKVGPKFLRITDIQDDFINWASVPYCKISEKDHTKYKLDIGDVVIARTGNSTGAIAVIKNRIDAVFASYLIRFSLDSEKVDYHYIDFVFRTALWKGFVKGFKAGSAQGGINAQTLSLFELPLPSLETQKEIAAMLGSFDDKIELLRRENKTLESIAQTLFKEWFVDFKFPGHEKVKFVDGLPEGWKVGKLGDVVEVKGGTTPSTINSDFWNGTIHWTSPKDLSDRRDVFLTDTEKKITEEGLRQIGSGLLPKGTLLLSSRAPIGYLAISDIDISINQGYIAMPPNSKFPNYFMYLWIKHNMQDIIGVANGSTFLEISKASFKNIDCVIPLDNILKVFFNLIIPQFEKMRNNVLEIQTLSKLRDNLLNKIFDI